MSSSYKYTIPKVQRALVLQGGGALGAYQAGVFKSLYEKMKTNQNNDDGNDHYLFDIIAGTSVGAINGAILVSYFLENKKWEGSAERLESFWKYLSTPTPQISEALKQWKAEYEKGNNPSLASKEAARRYYSVKEFLKLGVEKVFTPIHPPKEDKRFCDSQNQWLVYDNQPLRKSIEEFAKFPIATSFEKGEPRLLVISVDAAEGTTVTFDSYEKEQGRRETEYGDSLLGKSIIIKYNEGIGVKHLMASSTLPEVYAYEEIEGRKFWEKRIGSQNLENSFKKMRSKVVVVVVDGSNEYKKSQEQMQRIPDLELYIVNVFNPRENDANIGGGGGDIVPQDFDGVKDRHIDIKYSDGYDAKTNGLLTDYVNLIERLISLGDDDAAIKEKINKILDEYTPRQFNTQEYKKYIDTLKNTFKIVKVVQIQRKDDSDSISGKIADFTSETISKLIQQGYEDALSK
ncbi:MAG TPA: patatin-like phospholipase family protein [Nitrososphaeraceae archaeon]|nr:patatin-like phospholipase family protein [Nitrososphaeraceae archaeon]